MWELILEQTFLESNGNSYLSIFEEPREREIIQPWARIDTCDRHVEVQ